MDISVTSLTGYNYCARKLFLALVLGIKEPPSKHLIIGSLLHSYIEKTSLQEEQFVKSLKLGSSFEEVKQIFVSSHSEILRKLILENLYDLKSFELDLAETYKNLWSTVSNITIDRASLIYTQMLALQLDGSDLWQALSPQLISELKLENSALSLKGRIDQIEDYSGKLLPVEFKSGKAPNSGAWKDHQLQLAAYSLLLEAKFGKPITNGIIFYLGSNTKIPQPINPFLKNEVVELVSKVKAMVSNFELPGFVENKNKCVNCVVKGKCYDQGFISAKLKQIMTKNTQTT